MKHIFVVNPTAGASNAVETIRRKLSEISGYDIEIYETKAPADATAYIRSYCEQHSDPVRFYACGGDGTLNEVASGVYGFPRASLSCYPCGSGNDFVKYYGGADRFTDIRKLLDAKEESIDLMKVNDRISINITNFGFDTTVAKTMIAVKRKKIIGGKRAYITGVVTALLRAMKTVCTVKADGDVINPKGKMLLCTVANGQYVGGSFRCAPRSDNTDGLLDICLVTPISRFTFIQLLGTYTRGEHLDSEKFKKVIFYRQAKKIELDAAPGFAISLDGEIIDGTHFEIEILPSAVRFAVPDSTVSATTETKETVSV